MFYILYLFCSSQQQSLHYFKVSLLIICHEILMCIGETSKNFITDKFLAFLLTYYCPTKVKNKTFGNFSGSFICFSSESKQQ